MTVTLDASCEPVLGSEDDDLSHPEFYAMKLRFDNRGDYLVAERPSVCAYAAFGIKGVAARLITDRRYFYGRRKEETKNVADGILGARSKSRSARAKKNRVRLYSRFARSKKTRFCRRARLVVRLFRAVRLRRKIGRSCGQILHRSVVRRRLLRGRHSFVRC
ncbi:MAG: hypothetical protein ACLUSP_04575 [Christensenellales bacterium]